MRGRSPSSKPAEYSIVDFLTIWLAWRVLSVLDLSPMDAMSLFLSAVGLAIFVEGLPYFISPVVVRRYLGQMQKLNDGTLRALGLVLMAMGLVVAYYSRH